MGLMFLCTTEGLCYRSRFVQSVCESRDHGDARCATVSSVSLDRFESSPPCLCRDGRRPNSLWPRHLWVSLHLVAAVPPPFRGVAASRLLTFFSQSRSTPYHGGYHQHWHAARRAESLVPGLGAGALVDMSDDRTDSDGHVRARQQRELFLLFLLYWPSRACLGMLVYMCAHLWARRRLRRRAAVASWFTPLQAVLRVDDCIAKRHLRHQRQVNARVSVPLCVCVLYVCVCVCMCGCTCTHAIKGSTPSPRGLTPTGATNN